MKSVWKYPIHPGANEIEMPYDAAVLAVQTQHDVPHIWVLANPDLVRTTRRFVVYGTGHEMPPYPGVYLGTFQLLEGSLVFHLFEEI